MITVPATEFSKHFGKYREMALHEPVAVTSHDRVTGYFISSRSFEAFQRFQQERRRVYKVSELPPDMVDAIANVRMDSHFDHLNALLDD